MEILIDKNKEKAIRAGDLVYSNSFGTHCMIFREWSTILTDHEYILIDIEDDILLDRADSIEEIVANSEVELIAKKSELTLTNIGGGKND